MVTVRLERLGLKPGDRVLDIGCGDGRHVGALARLSGLRIFGADRNREDLLRTRQRMALHDRMGQCRSRWWVTTADIRTLPFADESFRAVLCSEVLEHVVDHEAAAAEIARVLVPGGLLAVSVPRYGPERLCWALSLSYRRASGGHVRIYRQKALSELLEEAGFRVLSRHYAHALHSPYWWLKCLLGPDRKESGPASLYHRFLVWDLMKGPWITRHLDRWLNPVIGKSLVLYLRKESP